MSSTGPVEFEGVESALSKNLSGLELDNVTRILYGRSHPSLSLAEASLAAEQGNFELKSFTVTANPEQTRAPRRIRVAAIQNAIVLPTTASVVEQRDAIHRRVGEIIEAAGAAGVNIICLQEAWTMPFAFCTRERLPWTEFAESAETGPSTKFLSQRKQYAERQRRMSTLARSDAIQGLQNMPRKQNSSPLPEFPRIYERGHAHSRSWNPGYEEGHPMEPLQYQYDRIPPRDPLYREPPPAIFIPTINEPHPEHHSERQHTFHKQAKSFDVSSNERRLSYDRRASSLASRALPAAETSISAACHSLWAAKGHLEQLHALGISDPSSASTSFDSNTDSHSTTVDSVTRVEDADKKRSQYRCEPRDAHRKRMSFRSLLVQRKMLSTAAISSMDSNSMESSGPEPFFVSSMDSSSSDLEQRRLSLLNRQGASVPHMARAERDYSVDEKSDNLFREWSRVDPAYDDRRANPPLQRGVTHDVPSYNNRVHVYQRQHSVAAPLQTPLICYPDKNYFR